MKYFVFVLIGLFYLVSPSCTKKIETPAEPVVPIDTSPPELKLNDKDSLYVLKSEFIYDPGATAFDDTDGDISAKITSNWDSVVNTKILGTKIVTYRVKDAANNLAIKTRSVTVDLTATLAVGNYSGTMSYTSGTGAGFAENNLIGTATLIATSQKDIYKFSFITTASYPEHNITLYLKLPNNTPSSISVGAQFSQEVNGEIGTAKFTNNSNNLSIQYTYHFRYRSLPYYSTYDISLVRLP